MSDLQTQEPTRLLADPDLDPLLRRDLEIARTHASIPYSVEAGLTRFEQAIHGASTVPPGGSVAGLRVLGWFVGALALVGGIAGVGYLVRAQPDAAALAQGSPTSVSAAEPRAEAAVDEPSATAPIPAPIPAPTLAPEPTLAPTPADPSEAALAPTDAPKPSPRDDPKPSTNTHEPAAKHQPTLADEAAQINAARKALSRDPGQALALVEAAEQAFPNGAMLQERRGFAILALVGLGRTAEAETRADAYLERWPNGPLSRRVRDALGR